MAMQVWRLTSPYVESRFTPEDFKVGLGKINTQVFTLSMCSNGTILLLSPHRLLGPRIPGEEKTSGDPIHTAFPNTLEHPVCGMSGSNLRKGREQLLVSTFRSLNVNQPAYSTALRTPHRLFHRDQLLSVGLSGSQISEGVIWAILNQLLM